jgi:hypothetical protein
MAWACQYCDDSNIRSAQNEARGLTDFQGQLLNLRNGNPTAIDPKPSDVTDRFRVGNCRLSNRALVPLRRKGINFVRGNAAVNSGGRCTCCLSFFEQVQLEWLNVANERYPSRNRAGAG